MDHKYTLPLLIVLMSLAGVCRGFLPPSHLITPLRIRQIGASGSFSTHHASGSSSEDYENALLNNLKRTCIKQFLTQRSLQSFMYLLNDLRDPHTSDWIERFLDAPSLLNFHGTGAFNMTRFENWDSYFLELMKMPDERLIIQARRSQTQGRRLFNSGSKNNPYLQEQEHHIEIPIDIHPSSFVPRVMSVREQIAREFVIDLDLIHIFNDQILRSYHGRVRDGVEMDIVREDVFERNAMIILTDNMAMQGFVSSPIRKGNFDLLQLLSLHESIHRVLREYKELGQEKEVAFAWLRDYFAERTEDYFDGCQNYGRADDFVSSLLKTAPSVSSTNLVDPLAIATDILMMRSEVLMDWKYIVEKNTIRSHFVEKKSLDTAVKEVGK